MGVFQVGKLYTNAGVPQGTTLGPVAFWIAMINDFVYGTPGTYHNNDQITSMQQQLDSLQQWVNQQ